MQRWKGAIDLIFDAVQAVTNLAERTHTAAARKAFRPFTSVEPLRTPARWAQDAHDATTATVYETVRAVTRGVKRLVDVGTERAGDEACPAQRDTFFGPGTPLRSDVTGRLSWWIDHTESVLNGLCGDHLSSQDNGLDLGMSFRHQGHVLPITGALLQPAFSETTGKLCVFVHGLKCTEWIWSNAAERLHGDPTVTFGSLLQRDMGYTPFYVRYNTGRHISENGRLLSTLLTQLIAAYPRAIEEIVLVGHSMGGLVIRSATHHSQASGEPWVQHLRHVFCVGAPHLGAPLPRVTNLLSNLLRMFDTAGTQVLAEILNTRSAGMDDLQLGYLNDDAWEDQEPTTGNPCEDVPVTDGVDYYAIAATITRDPSHPFGQLLGDLFVRPPSALGDTAESRRRLPFRAGHVFGGMHHFDVANHPDVYAFIRRCIEGAPDG